MSIDTLTLPITPHPERIARDGRGASVGAILLVAAVLAASVTVGVFWMLGARWFVVRTPSMGTAAPVGTLVVTMPVHPSRLRVGEIVAFHPPTDPSETYTHRIIAIDHGVVHTRGDINGARDPWTLTGHDIIGRAVVVLPVGGWVLRALPLLLVIGGAVWLTTGRLRARWRGPARMLGLVSAFIVALTVLHPLVGLDERGVTNNADGTGTMTLVSTGLFPVEIRGDAHDGHANTLDLTLGQVGTTHIKAAHSGKFHLEPRVHLTGWPLVVAVALTAAPTLWSVLVGFVSENRAGRRGARSGRHRLAEAGRSSSAGR